MGKCAENPLRTLKGCLRALVFQFIEKFLTGPELFQGLVRLSFSSHGFVNIIATSRAVKAENEKKILWRFVVGAALIKVARLSVADKCAMGLNLMLCVSETTIHYRIGASSGT